MKISDTHTPFFSFKKIQTIQPILPTPPFLWEEKSEPPLPLLENFQKSNPSLYKGGGVQLCFSFLKLKKKHSLIEKLLLHTFLKEADNFGCLRFNTFDFQLKFNLKYTKII